MTIDVNLGGDTFISKPTALMTAKLNGPWVVLTMPCKDGRTSVLRPMPRHKHLMLPLRRFNTHVAQLHSTELCFPRSFQMQCLACSFRNPWANRAYCQEHRGRVVQPISLQLGRPRSVPTETGRESASNVRKQRSR